MTAGRPQVLGSQRKHRMAGSAGPMPPSPHTPRTTHHFSSLARVSRQPILPCRALERRFGFRGTLDMEDDEGEGSDADHKSEVTLPEGLWGQEIHWGLEVQEVPRDRDGLEEGRFWIEERMFLPREHRDRTFKPRSPSLQVARGDHHRLMFPVREAKSGSETGVYRHPRGRGRGWRAVHWYAGSA